MDLSSSSSTSIMQEACNNNKKMTTTIAEKHLMDEVHTQGAISESNQWKEGGYKRLETVVMDWKTT